MTSQTNPTEIMLFAVLRAYRATMSKYVHVLCGVFGCIACVFKIFLIV